MNRMSSNPRTTISSRSKKNMIEKKKGYLEEFLPRDVMCILCGYLDVKSLLSLGSCSNYLHSSSSRDEASWRTKCTELWKTKNFVCKEAKFVISQHERYKRMRCDDCESISPCQNTIFKSIDSKSAKEAYKIALMDAKYRNEITTEELCQGKWSFRFKKSAGMQWTTWDPWWNGKSAYKMVFLPDGKVMKLEKNNSGSKEDGLDEESFGPMNAIDIKWRFITAPLDLKARPIGGYLRLIVGGREVPTYVVRRSPTGNWGFCMESCWGCFSSFEMPPEKKGSMRDSNLYMTSSDQWREAFLYNNGATRLPEGKRNLERFERMWSLNFPMPQNVK